ncbi:MAG: DUF3048 domain-containing protein [Clostridia bacterium]|nr:DUF3048 domain-containing protein [Clostridia bacterium]
MINYGTGNYEHPRRKRRRYNYGRIFALLIITLAIVIGVIMLIAKGISALTSGNDKKVKEEEKPQTFEVLVKPWENMSDNETVSILSGLPVSKEEANKRPVAIMYHNRLDTIPQAGLSNAEIVYEIPTEGEVVAILGVFQDLSQTSYGPIRSIRSNVIDYALDNDAILVHYKSGEVADYGTGISNALTRLNSPSIDAGSYEEEMTTDVVIEAGTVQAEATTSSEQKVTTENQVVKFVSREGIMSVWAKKGFKTMREPENQVKLFRFGMDDSKTLDNIANNITIEYSWYQTSEFRYDPKAMVYKRFQIVGNSESQQMDSKGTIETSDDEPLEYKNVIIQFVTSDNGNINALEAGEGYYFTNGTYMPIKWIKEDDYEPTKYTDLAGNEIELNRGRTWISLVPKTITPTISEETKDLGKTSSRIKFKTVNSLDDVNSMATQTNSTEVVDEETKED